MTKKNPIYGQGFHEFSDERKYSNDPWHERYRYGSHIQPRPSGGPIGDLQADDEIWEKVCDALSNAFDIDASEMEVKVENNNVILTGNTRSSEEIWRAEELAKNVHGVEQVRNRLRVKYDQKSLS